MTTISPGHLDSLLNMNFEVDTLANLTFLSGAAAAGAVNSVTAMTGPSTYPSFTSLKVTSVNDANNTIVVTGYYTSAGDGYGGGGTTMAVPWYFTVVGQSGNDLLLAANGAAALTSLPASAVAADIQSGNSATLSKDLFVFAIDGATIGTDVVASQTLTFSSFMPGPETVAMVTASPPAVPVSVVDSAANVQNGLDALQGLAADIGSITLTDSGTPSLSLTAAQLNADGGVLKAITSDYTLTVAAGTSSVNIAGLSGHATTVVFSGDASQYSVTASNGTITVSGGGVSDQLTNVAAIKFADFTEIVASTPGSANAPTTGNITELYSAVLAREPDVGGLSFYQNALQQNPSTSLLTFATYFLNSGEYTSNPAHNYAQTTAGDEQFITDSYQNLLHRTPSASEVSFYETNVLAPAVANQTAGTPAYAAAQLQAHALMLVYFSASSEFLGDVQITAQNPASASHWLQLI